MRNIITSHSLHCLLSVIACIAASSLDAQGRIVELNGRKIEIYDGLLGVPQRFKDIPHIDETRILENKPIELLCMKGDNWNSFSLEEWNALSTTEQGTYQKNGIIVYTKFDTILIYLYDSGYVEKKKFKKYKSDDWLQIPNANQIQIIIDNLEEIQKALDAFGGEKLYPYADYWYKEENNGKYYPSTTNFSWKIVYENNYISDPGRVRLVKSFKK